MAKLVLLDREYWPQGGFGYWCPGCNSMHEVTVDEPNRSGAKWGFNGDFKSPTFTPSINYRVNTPDMKGYQSDIKSTVCHHFVVDGKIQFLGDCTHGMKGQTVDLPDFPDGKSITSKRAE